MASVHAETNVVRRNQYDGKWNVLFDKFATQWMSFKPQEGLNVFPCYACRDMFGSKRSFLDHVNRRGIMLSYKCKNCSQENALLFYNPCSLLLHTRNHYNSTGGQIDLDDLSVGFLPIGLAGFLPHPDIPMIYDADDDPTEDVNLNTRFYSPILQDQGKRIIHLVPTILLFYYTPITGTPSITLILKQVCTNIPHCKFVILEKHILSSLNNGFDSKRTEKPSTMIVLNNSPTKQKPSGDNHLPTISNTVIQQKKQDNEVIQRNKQNSEVIQQKKQNTEVIQQKKQNTEVTQQKKQNTEVIQQKKQNKEEIQFKKQDKETENQIVDLTSSDAKKFDDNFNCCPECKKVQTTSMSVHFLNGNRPIDESINCTFCKYIAPSACSLKAHQRIHEGILPFVCPECGKDFSSCESLLDHLDDVCFHLAKQVRYRCPKPNCCKVFAHMSTFTTHFAVHVQSLTMCCVCDTKFSTLKDYLEHTKTSQCIVAATNVIHRCTVCKNGGPPFNGNEFLNHVKLHCSNRAHCVYVYVCKYCRNFFRSTMTYATHLLRCSKKVMTGEESSKIKKSNTVTKCNNCNYIIRMVMTISYCPKCGEPFHTVYPIKRLEEKTGGDTTSVCLLCQKEMTLEEYLDHIKENKCRYCKPVVTLNRIDLNLLKSEEATSKRKRKKESISPTSTTSSLKNKKLHVLPSTQLEDPVPFSGIYHCSLCSNETKNRPEFHDHITKHRDISTAYQCMECGECFVVKPSLQKHLFYYHQVTDFEAYVENNECFDRNAVSELRESMHSAPGESKQPVAENQCCVCLNQFKDRLELNKHFRMHGMAFLMKNSK